ncbi:MAG: DUF2088 domain-containing protein [Firmicutes bacterium]|nr:DUF2088 domain-containing protein [Bacillota bacterium]
MANTFSFLTNKEAATLVPGGLKVQFPLGLRIRQKFDRSHLSDVQAAVRRELSRPEIKASLPKEGRIAVAVGSRGIADLDKVVQSVISSLKEAGYTPFIVPSMGSHGGANPVRQAWILAEYGISQERLGVEVVSSLDVVKLGEVADGVPVYFSRDALEADGIVVINRIKLHTCFRGPIESGLVKMLTIGLGKHEGARALHHQGFPSFPKLLPEAAKVILDKAPVSFGVALVENAYEQLCHVEAVPAGEILDREPELLKLAISRMGRILTDKIDLLIVDEIGKNISGDGMDPNITGRYCEPSMRGRGGPEVQKIVVLGLTKETEGNGIGIGMADITTEEVLNRLDFQQMYTNSATSRALNASAVPVVMPTARDALALGLLTLHRTTPEKARVVRIKNTLELGEIWVSQAVWEELKERDDVEALGELEPLSEIW